MSSTATFRETAVLSYRGPIIVRTMADECAPYRTFVGYQRGEKFYEMEERWSRSPEGAARSHDAAVAFHRAALDADGRPITAPERYWYP